MYGIRVIAYVTITFSYLEHDVTKSHLQQENKHLTRQRSNV